ncbi:MAG: lactate racemase domain-containing protein [Bacteroidia bacterium]|nr:lactate racemase domain-containing protein [Bacteroidia bacterium]
MMYFAEGKADTTISLSHISDLIDSMLSKLGKLDRILLLPPDFTRYHSYAGEIVCLLYEKLKSQSHVEIMPAVGTHTAMSGEEISLMFPGIPHEHFKRHDWQKDVIVMGTIPSATTSELTGGLVDWPINCEINRLLVEGNWDQIISVGQLVPHELIGIANHNKNILVGTGGKDIIGKTHMIGALYGTEKMMGHISSPVRKVLNYMSRNFIRHLPVSYIMTVRGTHTDDQIVTRGIFAGNDEECYLQGAKLCQQVNISLLNKEFKKVVAYLDPEEFKSVWVGNKALLRTQMCIADGGELIILCAGIQSFGENAFTDSFIRKYGYRDPEVLLQMARDSGQMMEYMVPLSQMMISHTNNRFKVTYAAKKITRQEIESVFCNYADYDVVVKKYDPLKMKEGENIMPDGEEVFYVSKPAQGLWAEINRFRQNE